MYNLVSAYTKQSDEMGIPEEMGKSVESSGDLCRFNNDVKTILSLLAGDCLLPTIRNLRIGGCNMHVGWHLFRSVVIMQLMHLRSCKKLHLQVRSYIDLLLSQTTQSGELLQGDVHAS